MVHFYEVPLSIYIKDDFWIVKAKSIQNEAILFVTFAIFFPKSTSIRNYFNYKKKSSENVSCLQQIFEKLIRLFFDNNIDP